MKYSHFILVLWVLVNVWIIQISVSCVLEERRALLQFKASLNKTQYAHPILPSWIDVHHDHEEQGYNNDDPITTDCCNWEGVKCSDATGGRIVELQLSDFNQELSFLPFPPPPPFLSFPGQFLNLSIFLPLKNLRALDFSRNNFQGLGHAHCEHLAAGFKSLQSLNLDGNFLDNTTLQCLTAISSLRHLSLAGNMLSSLEGCERLASFKNLESLNLDKNSLSSYTIQCITVIPSLKNLSLAYNQLDGLFPLKENNLKQLEHLDLSNNNISRFPSLKELKLENLELPNFGHTNMKEISSIGVMTSLKVLSLGSNGIVNDSSFLEAICNLKNLVELDLSGNYYGGNIPMCLGNLTSLRVLDISDCDLSGSIPSPVITSLVHLEYLSLSSNNFEGSFSLSSFTNHSKLQVFKLEPLGEELYVESEDLAFSPSFQLRFLYLARCNLNNKTRQFPIFLFYQKELTVLDLSYNNLVGKFPNWLLENNTRLEVLDLRENSFTGPFLSDGTPKLQHLQVLLISNNKVDGQVPQDIGLIFPSLRYLNLSKNYFEGTIPESLGNLTVAYAIDLSHNKFSGEVPDRIGTGCVVLKHLLLSNNKLQGYFPSSSTNFTALSNLQLANNYFAGSIPPELCRSRDLQILDISNNQFQGKIPRWIGNFTVLLSLNLSRNQLEGTIPYDICKLKNLSFLDLSRNLLNGSIPPCSSLGSLQSIHLGWNQITGSIPNALLENSNFLVILDFSHNSLSGGIPHCIIAIRRLKVLLLGGNNLQGQIPVYICQLTTLSIMDLSQNNFSGRIPSCLNYITFEMLVVVFSMELDFMLPTNFQSDIPLSLGYINIGIERVQETVEFRTKRMTYKYAGNILRYMSGIDLSCNQLIGEIPPELGEVNEIRALNLSHNYLAGSIPSKLSLLNNIESLDLSYNNLSGQIPFELTNLHFLSIFNVSYNNLSGKTPVEGQFANFDESNYRGNPNLCGPLLPRHCEGITGTVDPAHGGGGKDNDGADYVVDFFWSFSVSFVVALVTLALTLYLNPHYRRVWSNLIDTWILSRFYRRYKSCSK